ncbi:MAG: beta-galactosidase [Bryobacterales bacterium]|nr:beta-galactosidase [Bryobacterales bacterium]
MRGSSAFVLMTLAAAGIALAQDVAMGVRQGSGKRFEAPYTLSVETPHVKWAKPLAGGPIRLLAVPTVGEGRTLVELAQRLSLELTTVSIDPAWDLNKWTMAFGDDYGARAEKGDLKLVYSYLERELTSDKKFDVILLPLNHGWEQLTPASREALARRVREGCGLVLVRPFAAELSPLTPLDLKPEDSELDDPGHPGRTESSPWRRVGEHYITRAVPVEAFPFADLQNFLYRAEPGATVLIQTASGRPILAERPFGKGRVLAFGYRNQGMSWLMPMAARGHLVDAYWEYFYAMLSRSLIYAAGREPAAPTDWDKVVATWRLKNALGVIEKSGKGPRPAFTNLSAGRHFLEQQTPSDWNVTVIDVAQPDKVEDLTASAAVIQEGQMVTVKFRSTKPSRIELVDGLGRVIARAEGANSVDLRAGQPLTHSGFVRATCGTAIEQIPVQFAASSREWKDYEVMLPWFGPKTYQPWIPAVDQQLRRIGITTLADPDRNFKIMASAHLPGFGIYWYRRDAYLKRKADYARTKDTKFLTREVELQSPAFDAGLRAQLEKSLRPTVPLKPMAVYLADESSLTFYGDAFDVSWSPEAIAGFRTWLQAEYPSLEALNSTWGTSFTGWETILPMTTEEVQKHGNYAPWSDHRVYMEQEFGRAFGRATALVHEMDPGGRASISGTQVPGAHNGCNWYEIDQQIDYLQPYSDGNQDAMHHLFRPGLTITGFTGYGLTGDEAQYQQWQRLFYGHSGASIFWQYTLVNPDLTLSEQGKALSEAFGRLQAGIGRAFMNSTVREDGVAIHFSMSSIRGAWITDGQIKGELDGDESTSKNYMELGKRRDAWTRALEQQNVQFRFLATPQIEAGLLDKFKFLILPYSIALSDKEAREIERFMDRGGIVIGDDQTGRMDARCRWRQNKDPIWAAGRKGFERSGPRDLGLKREYAGDFLVTVRDFGKSRLTGVLPKKATTVRAPAGAYDLLRGGPAKPVVEASPSQPALFVERASKIAKLTIDRNLELRLDDAAGAPVDLSVVRVEVVDPAGQIARHYSGNVTVKDGRAAYRIPFAVNDATGAWRVRARDVLSGLAAEVVVRR